MLSEFLQQHQLIQKLATKLTVQHRGVQEEALTSMDRWEDFEILLKAVTKLCGSKEYKGRLMQISGSRDHQGVVLKTSLYPYAEFVEIAAVQLLLLKLNVK